MPKDVYGAAMKFPAGWLHREEEDAICLGGNADALKKTDEPVLGTRAYGRADASLCR